MPEPIPFPSAVSPVRRALVSVHDKTGIVELARELASRGVRIISTGGTAAHLKKEGVEVASVEETTGFPEILGGRVKTLHPKIFGGDRKSTRLNSSHVRISYAVFCLKKKKKTKIKKKQTTNKNKTEQT